MKTELIDVLILHGKSTILVDELKELFEGLGASAGTVLDQPSGRRAQRAKVAQWIRTCRLALVLATFDEDVPAARTPRSNVIHELTLCSEVRPRDTVVLQETRNGVVVDLGSNLSGHLVTILFEGDKLHQAYPQLLKELRERGLFLPSSLKRKSAEAISSDDHIVIEFMKDMDALWKQGFDLAWERIRWGDYSTLRCYADNVDHFFVCYWNVFDAFIRRKETPQGLAAFAKSQYETALHWLEPVWREIAHASMTRVSELKEAKKLRFSQPLMASFQKAEQKLSQIRKDANMKSRVGAYIEVGETLYELVGKLEASQ